VDPVDPDSDPDPQHCIMPLHKVSVADSVPHGSVPVLLGKLDLNPNHIKLESRIRIRINSRYYALLRIRIRDPVPL
jgi:hypothetical protein